MSQAIVNLCDVIIAGRRCGERVRYLTLSPSLMEHECHEDRKADTIGCVVMVAKIATREISEEEDQRSAGKIRSGQAGAEARAEKLTVEESRSG